MEIEIIISNDKFNTFQTYTESPPQPPIFPSVSPCKLFNDLVKSSSKNEMLKKFSKIHCLNYGKFSRVLLILQLPKNNSEKMLRSKFKHQFNITRSKSFTGKTS